IQFVPASHEDQENPGVWKKILFKRDDLLDGRVQMVNWAKLPAGNSFQLHLHEDMEEVFILVTGTVTIGVGEETEEMSAGDAVAVPAGTKHEMRNSSDKDAEYIVFGITTGDGTGKTITF
ncbi:MAG: cupin domain-containing protein, partial [Patescibacteria group bacterium]